MFNFDNGLLTIKQIDVPKINMNVMQPIQESYLKYITETVYKDMDFLVEELRSIQGLESLGLIVTVGRLVRQTFTKTQTNNGRYYYPVMGTFTIQGCKVGHDMELLRIPYMDDYGKINVMGASKVVLTVQRASEDISYSLKNNTFNIAMPYANVQISANKKSVKLRHGNARIPMDRLIAAMLHEAGSDESVCKIFSNTFLLNTFKLNEYTLNEFVYESLKRDSNVLDKFKSVQYELGMTRESLNEVFTLYRAVGETLSRDICQYREGQVLTEEIIADLIKQRQNIVYVRTTAVTKGYFCANHVPIILPNIPKGFKNCAFLRRRVSDYAQYEYFPEDVTPPQPLAVISGMPLTTEIIEFLQEMGIHSITVTAGTSKKELTYSFEREICGNYTARLKELSDTIPPNRYADEWVYYYNNPNLEQRDDQHLTAHDMIAILSAIGQIMVTGESFLLNRDTSYLKKILMINEVFSENLRKAITSYVKHYQSSLPKKIVDPGSENCFFGLTKEWMKQMNAARVIATADTINLSAEISQACHVNTIMATNAEVVDEMRHLAMPMYGRICPFETPAGKKLGLVNTRAIGAKVENNLLKTPYRKVLKTATGIRVSNNITYLTVKEELGHTFGDLLSLKQDENGEYLNTKIIARIPNPDNKDEPYIYATINSFDLAGGYVDAYPEQFMSPTAALIPCAGSDDAIRISYGLSQMRQALYQQNSEIPLVRTFMYEDMFTYTETHKFYAPCEGTVTSINPQRAKITEDITGKEFTVPMQISDYTGSLDMTLDVIAKNGQHVKSGDLLAEGFKYPQAFVVRAPFSGTIHKIRDNCIEILKSDHMTSFINLDEADMIAFDNGRIMGQSAVFMNIEVSVGDYVNKGDIIATTSTSRQGIYSPSRNELVMYAFDGYNHEDGVCVSTEATVNYTTLVAHSIDKKIYKSQFPHATANPLHGFKYCSEGDVVGEITTSNDVNGKQMRTEEVLADFQNTGIPYEHTTLEDTPEYRKYRWHLLDYNQLHRGDKMAGRHGNKGTVSKVLPNSQMPILKNGLQVNIVLNPAGLPSRMNLGQIKADAHLGLIAKVLGLHIQSDPYNGATIEDVKYLMNFAYDLANTENIYDSGVYNGVCKKYGKLPPEMFKWCYNKLSSILDWTGVFNRDGDCYVYDHESGTWLEYPVTVGYAYFFKLEQEDYTKLNYRYGPLEEQYSRTTQQPQKGDNSHNGQRIAEMELMSLVSYGASELISEILNESSDNVGARTNTYMEALNLPYRVHPKGCFPRATENLLYLLEAMGAKLDVPEDVVDVSTGALSSKVAYNIRKAVHKKYDFAESKQINLRKNMEDVTPDDFEDCADFFEKRGIT